MIPRRFCNAIATVAISMIAGVFYLAIDRDPPFVRIAGEIRPSHLRNDEPAGVFWKAKYVRDCPGTIQRWVIDSKGDYWPLQVSAARYASKLHVPNQPVKLSDFIVPEKASCGPAFYHVESRYVCNWTQFWFPIFTDKPDIPFTIACK